MLFFNRNIKVINHIKNYYEGKVESINCRLIDIENALEYTKRNRSDYPDEVIEKLSMVKRMLE